MRVFLAVDLSVAVVEKLVRLQEEIEFQLSDDIEMRWTDPRNIHATLKFFGEIEDALLPFVKEKAVEMAKPLFAFDLTCQGIGAFPTPEEPRFVWAGFDQAGTEVLSLLQKTVEREMADLGFAKDDRPFQSHVTLGRVKSASTTSFAEVAKAFEGKSFGTCQVRDFALFESRLETNGPVYRVLDRFALGG